MTNSFFLRTGELPTTTDTAQASLESAWPFRDEPRIGHPDLLGANAFDSTPEFLDQLKSGLYLGILESYDVRWSIPKVHRDLLQNFFDPRKTLDGVEVVAEVSLAGVDAQSSHKAIVRGPDEYDFRKLLHLGGSGKIGDASAAGGFGEGAKIAALQLLRDYGCESVKFGSGNWHLEFTLQNPPSGSYDLPGVRGLFAKLTVGPQVAGSYLEFESKDESVVGQLPERRNLFYHSQNPDFQAPSFAHRFSDGAEFGYQVLVPTLSSSARHELGNVYDAGQRRAWGPREDFTPGVQGLNVWCRDRKMLSRDRDRGGIYHHEFRNEIIVPLLSEMPPTRCVEIVQSLKNCWSELDAHLSHFESAQTILLHCAVDRLKQAGIRMNFPDKCVAVAHDVSSSMLEAFESEGYVACHGKFAGIGMKSTDDVLDVLRKHLAIDCTSAQLEQCELLYQAVDLLDAFRPSSSKMPIVLFDAKKEESFILGQYFPGCTWIAQEKFSNTFASALSTYLHELDHRFGTDDSAEFSYALTHTLERVIDVLYAQNDKVRELVDRWNELRESGGRPNETAHATGRKPAASDVVRVDRAGRVVLDSPPVSDVIANLITTLQENVPENGCVSGAKWKDLILLIQSRGLLPAEKFAKHFGYGNPSTSSAVIHDLMTELATVRDSRGQLVGHRAITPERLNLYMRKGSIPAAILRERQLLEDDSLWKGRRISQNYSEAIDTLLDRSSSPVSLVNAIRRLATLEPNGREALRAICLGEPVVTWSAWPLPAAGTIKLVANPLIKSLAFEALQKELPASRELKAALLLFLRTNDTLNVAYGVTPLEERFASFDAESQKALLTTIHALHEGAVSPQVDAALKATQVRSIVQSEGFETWDSKFRGSFVSDRKIRYGFGAKQEYPNENTDLISSSNDLPESWRAEALLRLSSKYEKSLKDPCDPGKIQDVIRHGQYHHHKNFANGFFHEKSVSALLRLCPSLCVKLDQELSTRFDSSTVKFVGSGGNDYLLELSDGRLARLHGDSADVHGVLTSQSGETSEPAIVGSPFLQPSADSFAIPMAINGIDVSLKIDIYASSEKESVLRSL